ncbi:hypothetical protein NKH18_04005 [Streptomyces sp. M10(2022)]
MSATNASESPAGLLGVLELTTADGVRTVVTDAAWRTTDREPTGEWHSAEYDDTAWSTARSSPPGAPGPGARCRWRTPRRPAAPGVPAGAQTCRTRQAVLDRPRPVRGVPQRRAGR